MSFDLIPQLIIVISTGIIVIIFGKNIPKVKDLDDKIFSELIENKEEKKFYYLYDRFKKRISKEEYQRRIDLLWRWFEKFLRKIRISFLRFDNRIVSLLNKLREKNTETDIDKNIQADNMEECDAPIIEAEKYENREFQKEEMVIVTEENIKPSEDIVGSITEEEKAENVDNKVNPNKKAKNKKSNLYKENTKGKEKEYIDLIMKNPIDVKSYWQLGIIYSRRRNYHDAISCFRQITKIDPTYTKAKKKISDLVERMKKKEKEKENENENEKMKDSLE
ncbi:MAG: tetratricopeptide repeat protein [Candidatus Pacebacteria bacterium]|nr:tetratricopeptide repeat protein [Candidatus Paceibacterota bacterium]